MLFNYVAILLFRKIMKQDASRMVTIVVSADYSDFSNKY